jgi:microcystin-dependent protein
MATISVSNPAPIFDLPVFIPENWSVGVDTTSSSSNYSLYNLIGQITMFEGSTPPTNWVWCDGTQYPTSEYPELFGFIGYTYGGSGANFAVPNCLGKSPYGADNTGVLTATYQGSSVATGGNRNLTEGQLVSHNHSVTINPTNMIENAQFNEANRGENYPSNAPSFKNFLNYTTQTLSITAGSAGGSADLLPPFCVVKYIIRVQN